MTSVPKPLLVIINRAIIITFTLIIIIITRSNAALRAVNLDWIVRQDTVRAGTFWGVLNVLLRVSSTQLGLDLTCFDIRHGKNLILMKRDTQTDRHHISIIYRSPRCSLFRPSEKSGSWTLVVEDCQPEDSGSYRCQVRKGSDRFLSSHLDC